MVVKFGLTRVTLTRCEVHLLLSLGDAPDRPRVTGVLSEKCSGVGRGLTLFRVLSSDVTPRVPVIGDYFSSWKDTSLV